MATFCTCLRYPGVHCHGKRYSHSVFAINREFDYMPTPNVDVNELLYRQIGPGGDPIYFDPERNPPVHQSRFLPTSKDADGLSLVRGRFRTEIWSAYRMEQPAVRFRLALLHASRIQHLSVNLGFQAWTLASTTDALDAKFGAPWAHCVAGEINRAAYDNDSNAKIRIKEWAMQVANLLTNQEVLGPFQEPTDVDSYRPQDMPV